MYQHIKDKWLKALRSGEYKQGREMLKYKDKFCCLGVLCDLHAKETGTQWKDYPDRDLCSDYFDEEEVLPEEVMMWAGLNETDPVIRRGQEFSYGIAYYNDHGLNGFDELADLIEKYL